MIKAHLIIIIATGGAKGDFVAGWLSNLPNFIDNSWNIELSTGISQGAFKQYRDIDDIFTIEEVNEKLNIELTVDKSRYTVGTCHGFRIDEMKEFIDSGLITPLIISVDGSKVDKGDIFWNYAMKTFLTDYRNSWAIESGHDMIQRNDPSLITDEEKIAYIERRMIRPRIQIPYPEDIKTLQYHEVLINDGSKLLCEALDLEVPQIYHDYWNAMLPFSDAPDSIDKFGKTWRKTDYFNK